MTVSPRPALAATRAATHPLVEVAGWVTLAGVLVGGVPLFLCMPLTSDVAFYDLCARQMLWGGAMERDILMLPPPGLAWAFAVVRSLFGWSSVAVRAADLAVVAAAVALLLRWLRRMGLPRALLVWVAAALFAFYLTTSEWCHCQPDMWMFLPAVAALYLRTRQVEALNRAARSPGQMMLWGVLEGLLWGAACLIKPFVALPGLGTWLASAALLRRSGPGWRRRLVCDAAGLLVGGLLMGAAWQGWLLAGGTFRDYWGNYAAFKGDWYATAWGWKKLLAFMFQKMPPWGALHAVAILIAGVALGRAIVRPAALPTPGRRAFLLLAAFYLGWVVQANFLQFQFNYHLVPSVVLAVVVVAGLLGQNARARWGWVALFGFTAFAVGSQPACTPARLAVWGRCWREGPSPEVRDLLSLNPGADFAVGSTELDRVAGYLRAQGAGDGEVTCYSFSTMHLYLELGIKPSTRFAFPETAMKFFPRHRQEVLDAVRASGHRYLVSDMLAAGLSPEQAAAERPGEPLALPPDFPARLAGSFPHSSPVVFRAGRYYVHDVGRARERHGDSP
jgi:hypothetical protein